MNELSKTVIADAISMLGLRFAAKPYLGFTLLVSEAQFRALWVEHVQFLASLSHGPEIPVFDLTKSMIVSTAAGECVVRVVRGDSLQNDRMR